MDLKELRYIVTIADSGSISAAAQKLFMAQSSLSQFLQLYEAELGTSLFYRTSKGVRPTSSGSVFISHARQILQQYHLAQSEIWDIEGLNGGQIEFGISTFRGVYLIPRILKEFRTLYPNVHVEITEMDSADLENLILEGLLDIALIAAPSEKIKNNWDFLMKDEIVIVAERNHPVLQYARPCSGESERKWIDLKDTENFEFILGEPGTVLGKILRNEFLKHHMKPICRNTNISAPLAAAMASEGLGLAATYRSCIGTRENTEYLRIGTDGVFLDLALTYPAGEYRSRAAIALGRLLHQTYLHMGA